MIVTLVVWKKSNILFMKPKFSRSKQGLEIVFNNIDINIEFISVIY